MYFARNFNQLEGPLRMLRFVSNFFGSSPIATEWDKIVAEIINTTFVFLGHPRGGAIIILFWKFAIAQEPNVRLTSNQAVNSSLYVV